MNKNEYRFGDCVVDVALREVRLGGIAQAIPKKAFDLLTYLIVRRDRVVHKEEIFRDVWDGRTVTENVLARAVMLARAAIGDVNSQSPLIRTITRVGYRFVVSVQHEGPVEAELDHSKKQAPESEARIAFLPFANKTDEVNLDWVELGLMSLVIQSLHSNLRVRIASAASVLTCLGNAVDERLEDRCARLEAGLGVEIVISVAITRADDLYEMSFQSFGSTRLNGDLRTPKLTDGSIELAKIIQRSFLPLEQSEPLMESGDPFANECLARGMKAVAVSEWGDAEKLLSVVLELEPKNIAVTVLLAYAHARLGNASSIVLGERLIAAARVTGDKHLEMQGNYITGLGYLFAQRRTTAAIPFADEALRIGSDDPSDDWVMRAFQLRFNLAHRERDFATCQRLSEAAEAACRVNDNKVLLLSVLNNRAVLEAELGDKDAALSTAVEAGRLAEQFSQPLLQSYTLTNRFVSEVNLGKLSAAMATVKAFLPCIKSVRERIVAPQVGPIFNVDFLYRLHEYSLALEQASALEKTIWKSEGVVSGACRVYCDAYRHFIERDMPAGLASLKSAATIICRDDFYAEAGSLLPSIAIKLARAGQVDEAEAWLQKLLQFPQYARDSQRRITVSYASSLMFHKRGQSELCQTGLEQTIEHVKHHWYEADIRTDLAWMHLSAGDLSAASAVFDCTAEYANLLPAGLIVHSMIRHLRSDAAAAVALHDKLSGIVNAEINSEFAQLGLLYKSSVGPRLGDWKQHWPSLLPSCYRSLS